MITVTSAQIDGWVAVFVWPFFRILALLATAPLLHDQTVAARVKIGLALVITMLVAPTLPAPHFGISLADAPALLAQQLLIGFALGFAIRVVFAAVELAGDQIGLQMGLSFAGFIDPASSTPAPILASFLGMVAGLLYLALNGHLHLIAALVDSFAVWPIAPSAASVNAAQLVGWGGELFRLGLHISLPVLATMLLINLALGVLARSAPQLNVFAVGFPATLLAGFGLFAAMLPIFGPVFQRGLEAGLQILLR